MLQASIASPVSISLQHNNDAMYERLTSQHSAEIRLSQRKSHWYSFQRDTGSISSVRVAQLTAWWWFY